jgi:hypothetical protein
MLTIEWLRQFRIGPFAIFDTIGAFLGIWLLAPLLSWITKKFKIKTERVQWLLLTLPLSVISHFIIGQQTPLIEMLLASPYKKPLLFLLILLTCTGIFWQKMKKMIKKFL